MPIPSIIVIDDKTQPIANFRQILLLCYMIVAVKDLQLRYDLYCIYVLQTFSTCP